jgi:Asp-tRNA(Asn)/Glu-tRNA(Gln) amidotransferase A subunit family amidase
VPAHFSGICGLKPTPGRVSTVGHQPACLGPFSLTGVVGPMARRVGDLRLLLHAIETRDLTPAAFSSPARRDLPAPAERRVAMFEDDGERPVTAETRRAVQMAASALEAAGYVVERRRPAVLERAGALWDVFFCDAGRMALHEAMGGAEDGLPILAAHLARNPDLAPISAQEFVEAWIARDLACAELAADMDRWPLLLCPVAAVPAFGHGERSWTIDGREVGYIEAMRYTQWFNILGNPAAVVPVTRSAEGLPIGVQVVGRPFEERFVLDAAEAIEQRCGGYEPPPAFAGA